MMEEHNVQQNNETGISLQQAVSALMNKRWLVVFASVLGALLILAVTVFFVTPKYEASVMFYVNNNSMSVGDGSFSIDSGDISASKSLVNSYIVILNSRESLEDVIDYADVKLSCDQLKEMVSASAVNSTEIFEVVVTSSDPQEAELLANAIAQVLPARIASIIEGSSAKVVNSAILPSDPSSPSYVVNTIIGFLLGFVLSVGIIVLMEIFNTEIQSAEDIARCCNLPILASVPDMVAPGKGGYYGYGEDGGKKKKAVPEKRQVIGGDISFAASEAYKLLRTMLEYSFADEKNCHVIGVTSALTGEGKSLTAINLSLNLSQMQKKVLLIDCDLRRPSIAAKLRMDKNPGLSAFLSGQKQLDSLIRPCGIKNNEQAFHVITSGTNPPNPVELLGSVRMEKLLEALQEPYDYIILDLPPIGEVSDALVVARQTDGMLMVVRENYCTRSLLADAVRKLEFVDTRILGVAYNCTSEEAHGYGKRYSKQYYKRYYKHYSKSRSSNVAEGPALEIPHVEV